MGFRLNLAGAEGKAFVQLANLAIKNLNALAKEAKSGGVSDIAETRERRGSNKLRMKYSGDEAHEINKRIFGLDTRGTRGKPSTEEQKAARNLCRGIMGMLSSTFSIGTKRGGRVFGCGSEKRKTTTIDIEIQRLKERIEVAKLEETRKEDESNVDPWQIDAFTTTADETPEEVSPARYQAQTDTPENVVGYSSTSKALDRIRMRSTSLIYEKHHDRDKVIEKLIQWNSLAYPSEKVELWEIETIVDEELPKPASSVDSRIAR